jgi:hypothetical protein
VGEARELDEHGAFPLVTPRDLPAEQPLDVSRDLRVGDEERQPAGRRVESPADPLLGDADDGPDLPLRQPLDDVHVEDVPVERGQQG